MQTEIRVYAPHGVAHQRVIMRTNEYEPYKTGRIIGLSLDHHCALVIEVDSEGIRLFSGVVVPETDEMKRLLDDMTIRDQISFLYNMSRLMNDLKSAARIIAVDPTIDYKCITIDY